MLNIKEILSISPVIPVVVMPPSVDAVALAKALSDGGIGIIEVTLRTSNAMDAIRAISAELKDICVGAGTVWNREEAEQAIESGAQFLVSPAFVKSVFEVCTEKSIPYLPGVGTVTEAAHCADLGLSAVKVFPANIVGGPAAIKAFASVLPDLYYCPTGGVNLESAADYLALKNIVCVGGSWLIDKKAVGAEDWSALTQIARSTLDSLSD